MCTRIGWKGEKAMLRATINKDSMSLKFHLGGLALMAAVLVCGAAAGPERPAERFYMVIYGAQKEGGPPTPMTGILADSVYISFS